MATFVADSHQAPQRSSAMHIGTDQLLALFEAEKAKVDAAANQRVQATEAKLENFHDLAQKTFKYLTERCTMLENANKRIARSLAESINETIVLRAQHIETQQRLTKALNELTALQQAARNSGTRSNDVDPTPQEVTIKTEKALVHHGAQSQGQGHAGDGSDYLLKRTPLALLELAQKPQILEDELKYARGSEVMVLKEQLSSIRNEMAQRETFHNPTGSQENMTGHMNAKNASNMSDTLHESITSIDPNSGTEAKHTNLPIAHGTQSTPLSPGVPLMSSSLSAPEQSPTSTTGSLTTPTTCPSPGIVQHHENSSTKRSEATLASSSSPPNAKRLKTRHIPPRDIPIV